MIKLTKRQEEVLKFIRDYLDENKTLPNKEEVRKHFNWKSPNASQAHFRLLFNKLALLRYDNNVGYILPEQLTNKSNLEKARQAIKQQKEKKENVSTN